MFKDKNSYSNSLDHSLLSLKEYFIKNTLENMLFKKNCLIKESIFKLDNKKKYFSIYISFLRAEKETPPLLKRRMLKLKGYSNINLLSFSSLWKKKNLKFLKNLRANRKNVPTNNLKFLNLKIFKLFSLYGFNYSLRIVFHNLNKIMSENPFTLRIVGSYKNEPYFKTFSFLLVIFAKTSNNSILIAYAIKKYFQKYYRSRKLHRFLTFVRLFSEFSKEKGLIQGIKVKIKGRFSGKPRSKEEGFHIGKTPIQTINSKTSYSYLPLYTRFGTFSLKIWLTEN